MIKANELLRTQILICKCTLIFSKYKTIYENREEEINCNTKVKSPRRIKKKEYSEFFENLVETKTLNLTEQRDFTNTK